MIDRWPARLGGESNEGHRREIRGSGGRKERSMAIAGRKLRRAGGGEQKQTNEDRPR